MIVDAVKIEYFDTPEEAREHKIHLRSKKVHAYLHAVGDYNNYDERCKALRAVISVIPTLVDA